MSDKRAHPDTQSSSHPTRRDIVVGSALVPVVLGLPLRAEAQSPAGLTAPEMVSVSSDGQRQASYTDTRSSYDAA